MSQPVIYLAVTNHGFGHSVRIACVAAEIKRRCPDIVLVLVTTAPHWLLKTYIQAEFIHRPRAFDVGVIQSDSLKMDKATTKAKMQQIIANQAAIIAEEVQFIQNNQVKLILADIPALAVPIAKAAGIPCWMMSNFGWDFIYQDWGEDFREIVAWIEGNYQECERLFRLPMAEPMKAFNNIIDVGLTGGKPRYQEAELRSKFNINIVTEKTILLTFGGLGLEQIPYQNLQLFPDWQFITFDRQAPELSNLLKITDNHYRPVDFMPICRAIISKPGYSTFAEALSLDVPIISLTRDDFAEAQFLLRGIQDYAQHQIITPAAFFEGNWEFLKQSLTPPRLRAILPKNGTEIIAQAVINFL